MTAPSDPLLNLSILKIGGSLIACKESEIPRVDRGELDRIASEIAGARSAGAPDRALVVVHGAGSYGHLIVSATGIDKGLRTDADRIAMARTQRLQNELNLIVTGALVDQGVPAFPFQFSSHAVLRAGRLESTSLEALRGLLSRGLVPVAFGVPAFDEHQGCAILSGDQITPYVARELNAALVVHATDVDGVFAADPKAEPGAVPIPRISAENIESVRKCLAGSAATDVTGGMARKVEELADLGRAGIPSVIVSGRRPGAIRDALLGRDAGGTRVAF